MSTTLIRSTKSLSVFALALGSLGFLPFSHSAPTHPVAAVTEGSSTVVPAFISSCSYVTTAANDPIVMPGMTGMGMLHDFFGNHGVNANSTPASLLAKDATSCSTSSDATAYWAPSLDVNGKLVTPTRLRAYYRLGSKTSTNLQPIPAGLEMIAGNSVATTAQSTSVVSWGCGQGSSGTAKVPVCSGPTLVLHVYFPDCWNGTELDSPDHMGHLAYTHNGVCPVGYPVKLPKVTEDIQYPVTGAGTVAFEYSGSSMTGHADFLDGWNQGAMSGLVTKCLIGHKECGVIDGAA